MKKFNGLGLSLGNLSKLSKAETRSISMENTTGEKGKGGMATEGTGSHAARDLGQGWKVSPSVMIKPGRTFTMADIKGQGAIQHIWMAGSISKGIHARYAILRVYWDNQKTPSVECPVADFFACSWGQYAHVNSLPVAVNPNRGYNCYWEMPFRKKCRITLENLHEEDICLYFQVDYTLTDVEKDRAYFHAQFRRVNPLPYKKVYTIVDGIKGTGHYVGTVMGCRVNSKGWWGEGEIKFYVDGDKKFSTICGTGTEDYFGGAYDWSVDDKYVTYSTPFLGMHQVLPVNKKHQSGQKFCMYRWHIMDPVRFKKDLKVTIQALGWGKSGKYRPRQDDIASVAFWYQALPTKKFPQLKRELLKV